MEVWIIREGEKVGPFHDFEIRRQISQGELAADVSAWHEGLPAWKALGEIPLFAREFEVRAIFPQEAATQPSPYAAPKPVEDLRHNKNKTYFIRRFWARWLDLHFYAGLLWLGMWSAGQNIEGAMSNVWLMFFHYVPWFIFEALLLTYWGSTPGKWLLGMRVANEDGSRLDLAAATKRSARVLFTGIGFGWDLLCIFCQAISGITARRLGKPVWDYTAAHQVEVQKLRVLPVLAFLCLFWASLSLKWIVQAPIIIREASKTNPELKQLMEEMRPWHLPESKGRD